MVVSSLFGLFPNHPSFIAFPALGDPSSLWTPCVAGAPCSSQVHQGALQNLQYAEAMAIVENNMLTVTQLQLIYPLKHAKKDRH